MYYLDARASENKTMGSTIPKYFEFDWRHPRAQFYLDVLYIASKSIKRNYNATNSVQEQEAKADNLNISWRSHLSNFML